MTERGTTAEFTQWVEPHLPALARFAARRVPSADRDDVVQEALIRAWQRWSTYDPERGSAVAWLIGILADRCRRHRVRSRGPTLELVETASTDLGPDVDLERAVARLPARQRTAVDLYYFTGLDVATVAEVMGCAQGTVKATLHHARARLRELMGDPDD